MRTALVFVAALAAICSEAATINWTNTSNGNWNVAANWNPNIVPTTNDTAVITNAGNYTVTLNFNPTIAGLIVGGNSGTQTLNTAQQTLTLNGIGMIRSHGVFNLALGSLSGANLVEVEGLWNWSGGTINTNASVTVAAGGQATIASGANFFKYLNGRLTNNGTIRWQLYGALSIGGLFHNQAGGVFDASVDLTLYRTDSGVIINDGVFRKSSGSGTLDCEPPLINSGTVEVQTGRLTLAAGSVLNDGCYFMGAGQTLMNSGSNRIHGNIHSENLSLLYNATLTGTGSISGTLTWGGGNIDSDAAITLSTNGTLFIASTANYLKNLHGRLTNAGTILWQPYSSLVIGGMLHNLPGALFDAQMDGTIIQGGGGLIVNEGVFRKSVGSGSADCELPFINMGTAKVSSGTLNFDSGFTNAGGTILVAGGTFKTLQPLWLSSGLLTGWGTVNVDVASAACIRPSCSNGVLTINGKYNQLLDGRIEFELGSNTPGTNQSRLNILGKATLSGTLGVLWSHGYTPPPATDFPVLTFASRAGEFSGFDNCILLGQGRRLQPVYTAMSLTLATVASPEPTNVPLCVSVNDSGALVHWPLEFTGYELYVSTDLSLPNWQLLAGATNRWFESAPLAREKFFRLVRP